MTYVDKMILEMMPFSDELKAYCEANPVFLKNLKALYWDKFIALGTVMITSSPLYPSDKVIGVHVYSYMDINPQFKQDYIVDLYSKGESFVIYTGATPPEGADKRFVKHINEFLDKYGGQGKYYQSTHHQTYEQLPDTIKDRARAAIALGEKRKADGNPPISEKYAETLYEKLLEYKASLAQR